MGQVISILCSELEGILRSLVEREENEARTNQVINKKNNTIAMAKEESSSVVSDLINFLNASPTAFHAVGTFLSFSLSLLFPFVSRENQTITNLISLSRTRCINQ